MSDSRKVKKRPPLAERIRQAAAKIKQIHPSIEIDPITSLSGKVKAVCKIDGHVWYPFVHNLLKGQGCPRCAGHIKLTHEEFQKRVAEKVPDVEIIGTYQTMNKIIKVRCRKCGYEWDAFPQSLLRGHGCAVCAGKKKLSTDEVREQLATLRPDVELLGEYRNPHERILYRFSECGHEALISTSHIKSGRGCPICGCARKGLSQLGNKERLQAELDRRFKESIEVLGEYINCKTPIMLRCKRCGHLWLATPSDVKTGHGCPECSKTGTSFLQEFFYSFVSHAFPRGAVLSRDKTAIGRELDIFIPSAKVAFEIGSWHWHKERLAADEQKYLLCRAAGIRLFTLYDHCDQEEPPFPGAIVTRRDLGAPESFGLLVGVAYHLLELIDVHVQFSMDVIERIRHEAYHSILGTTSELFKEEVARVNPHFALLGEYRGENPAILVKCKKCGYAMTPEAWRLRHELQCPRCRGRYYHRTHADFLKELSLRHPCMVVLDQYVNQTTPIHVYCKKRNKDKKYLPAILLSKNSCQLCQAGSNKE